MSPSQDKPTHFGYENVSFDEKTKKVTEVFNSVATRYDLMNDLMSLGVHRLWKQFAIEIASIRPTDQILDLASGTGDLALKMAPLLNGGSLFVTDINASMLAIARKRLIENGRVNNVHYLQVNAESIPFPDNSFDCVTIGFGLRNVTHKQEALNSIYRVLKPGGKLLILEFSHPTSPILSSLYDLYSFNVLPLLGKFFVKDDKSYRYLAESIRMHPNQETLCSMMTTAKFENCRYDNLTGGIVAIHRGYKID
ncbi:MAG: bifunctional demethylmenaquinone methyltransferase/2-methoxy-6-polyprenyl-1,4-benzoquinol methylase UbiE [Gammaproteobacteria bacterium]|nr:bifunctional demethylmenaquinone methyltransferase/2-methoxy-6-polyprenyl-1,4-benzoquinol methylase UbiE [Gammaproteobacteria bacterium]